MAASEGLKQAVRELLTEAENFQKLHRYEEAWKCLADAHIIGQAHAGLHTLVHWRMLKAAFRQRTFSEVFGQLPRVIIAAPGTWLRRNPLGNPGLSKFGMFKPMPIPEDLQEKIRKLK